MIGGIDTNILIYAHDNSSPFQTQALHLLENIFERGVVAVIPARGGSKRIPNKNIKSFAGQPIISYSIKATQHTDLFDRIIVSTDSEEITEVAKICGAEVPFIRPAELANDITGTDVVVLHALKCLLDSGENVNYICCIYATAPFVRSEDIHKGFEHLQDYNATSTFTVTSFPSPIFRALKINDSGIGLKCFGLSI